MGAINMAAKYRISLKDPGVPGVLRMGEERFSFTPNDPRSPAKLDVPFGSIKGHKFSKDGSKQALLNLMQDSGGYIFEFENFSNRNVCRDFVGDHGIQRDGRIETADADNEISRRRTLSQDLNRHASVVIEGRALDIELGDTRTVAEALARFKKGSSVETSDDDTNQERQEKATRMTEIDDLQGPRNLAYAPLCIKDPRDYFEAQQANAFKALDDSGAGFKTTDCTLNGEESYAYLLKQISEGIVKGMSDIIQPDVALKVLNGLNQHLASIKNHTGRSPLDNVLDRLPIQTKNELMHYWTSIQELLRHFWSSYPITTGYLYNKVLSMCFLCKLPICKHNFSYIFFC
ncbi:putative RNA polymerase II transcription factor B subunit 1-1 [Apostasia shenzhenica]|uniref:Putative RNA polymerase II transcription factor B subunit 1-1 n=1 Tax=Apostasia shenzhenica TaxID=1088818 RepID=A0A2I0AFQ6_9ASPA|nr:putative RNA polymerase II transcription factor B subunit 1-1 [Apostasia shenzhenica]